MEAAVLGFQYLVGTQFTSILLFLLQYVFNAVHQAKMQTSVTAPTSLIPILLIFALV
jgi:hypothetical protein